MRTTKSMAVEAWRVSLGRTVGCGPTNVTFIDGFSRLSRSAVAMSFLSEGVLV